MLLGKTPSMEQEPSLSPDSPHMPSTILLYLQRAVSRLGLSLVPGLAQPETERGLEMWGFQVPRASLWDMKCVGK